MNCHEVLNSVLLKKRFCRDNNLPISVYENPYFYERVCAIDKLFKSVSKFAGFCEMLEAFDSEQDFLAYYNQNKQKLIDLIKESDAYKSFLDEKYNISAMFPKRNVYIEENDGKRFVSIDMKKANFSALMHYSSNIFGGNKTWEEFVLEHTNCKYMASGKYIRQVIFGACNPKAQIQYEKYLTNQLAQHISNSIDGVTVFSQGEDEIIIDMSASDITVSQLKEMVSSCPEGVGDLYSVEHYALHKIKGTDGWMKSYIYPSEARVEFKCLEADIYHQIAKHYLGKKINKNDLVFMHNGKLAKFLKATNNPWK